MSQIKVTFENGWGASIIDHGYGNDAGLVEVGVLDPEGRLAYAAIPQTDDDAVVGWLGGDDLIEVLLTIAGLTQTTYATNYPSDDTTFTYWSNR